MSKATQKQRKVTFLLVMLFAVVLLTATVFSVLASGATGETQGWNFNNQAKYATTPIYMEKHIEEMPHTFEAYVNMTAKGTSPIISDFVKTNRGCVKFGVNSSGYPELRLQNFVFVPDNAKYYTIKTQVIFDGEDACILKKGWTHIAITYNSGVDGEGTFTLYVNGVAVQTKTIAADKPDNVEIIKNSATFKGQYPDIDIKTLQSDFRELSFGAEGSTTKGAYFRGEINSAALYSEILTADEIAAAYQNAASNSGSYTPAESVMAYYDYDMAGNDGTDLIKDQSGNGHDFIVSFYERESEPEDYAYSFAFVGDTQFTVKFEAQDSTKNYASSIYDWLVKNKDSKKIKYVLGLGDITESHTTPNLWPGEWELAVKLHEKLEAADMPYAIIEGNHDGYTNNPGTINQYFGDNEFFTNTITGYYKEGQIDSYYVNFEVGTQHKYMIVALEHGADDDVLGWANEVVAANPDRRVIVITHGLLGYDGDWTSDEKLGGNASLNDGIDIWNKFISLHNNIIIAAAGHIDVDPIKCKTAKGVNGNEVKTFLINPQTLDEANCYETGMIAMFYFSADGSDVQVDYISAYKTLEAQQSNPDAKDVLFGAENQFSFKTQKAPEYTIALYSGSVLYGTYDSYEALCQALSTATGGNYKIVFNKNYDISGDVSFPSLNGAVTIDLDGHTLTVNNALNLLGGNIALTVKNGTIVANNSVIGAASGAAGSATVTFENITFDFKSNASGITLFDLDDANIAVSVTVLGGKIVSDVSTLSSVTFYTKDAGDSVTFGAYNDAYTKLVTHTTAFGYNHYAGAFPAADGNRYLVEISDNGTESVYELQSLTVAGEDVSATIDIIGNAKYLSAVDYPFVVVGSTGAFFGISDVMYVSKSDTSAFELAKGNLSQDAKKHAYILMRSNYVLTNDETFDLTYIQGTVVLDMCGYSLTSPLTRSTHMFEPKLKKASYTTEIIVKNGAIKHGGKDANKYVVCYSNNNNAAGSKTFNFEFDSVTFSLVEGALNKKLFHVGNYNGYNSNPKKEVVLEGTVNFTITDCTFDLRNDPASGDFTVFDTNFGQSNAYLDSNVKINGGQIIANDLSKLKFTNFSCNEGDTVTFGAGSDGEFIKLVLPKNADASKFLMNKVKVKTESGKDIGFALDTRSDVDTYKMYFETKYGNVPVKYSDASKYPFLVFDNNGNFYKAAESFNLSGGATGAIAIVRDYLKANVWDATNKTYGSNPLAATILMMRNVQMDANDNYNNMYQIQGTVTIDLGGFELSAAQYKPMFYSVMNSWSGSGDATIFPTGIIVKNGKIKNQNQAVVRLSVKATGKEFNYTFENVTFNACGPCDSPFVNYENSSKKGSPVVEFNNCTFDITKSTATDTITIFGIGDQYINTAITVKGGSIIAGDKAFSMSNATTGSGSLTFGEYNGKYTTLSLAATSAAPAGSFNGGALSFVKTSATNSEIVYALAPVTVKEYAPKMSLTLDRNLILNVYIPVNGTQKFTLDNEVYENLAILEESIENIDGIDYYCVSIPLGAKEAAKNIQLKATVDFGSKTATGTFNFSVVNYAKVIKADNAAIESEKTLVCDVLAYIKAAYVYFGTDDAAAIGSIEEIIGKDYSAKPTVEGSATEKPTGFKTVTFVLDGTPAMRFYLNDDANASDYKFYIGGKLVKTEVAENGKYIDIDVYAYALCESVECKIGGENAGSFHINAYYAYVSGDEYTAENKAELVSLTESFWRYLQSARAYRNSVVNG